jgi:signal peptidase I
VGGAAVSARRWKRALWIAGGLAALLALMKSFVADVYRVETGSMRPTIFGGRERPDGPEDSEHVLVRYTHGYRPDRFDLVVMRAREEGPPIVKRVAGLAGEELAIRDGDLFVGGRRLGPDVPRPTPVCLFDSRWHDPQTSFEYRRDGSVTRSNDGWVVNGMEPVDVAYHARLTDGYLDRQHLLVPGLHEVNDGILELELRFEPPLADLRLYLVEAGDSFEVELSAKTRTLRLVRRVPRALADAIVEPETVWEETPVALEPGRWIDLSFANVDDHLVLRSSALGRVLRASYAGNRPCPPELGIEGQSVGPRVGFTVAGGIVRLRSVRVLRDLYYTEAGTYATAAPLRLGPDEYFLLGDNSAASTDSRHFGPVRAHELIGIPLAVVAPRLRWLRPVVEP